MLNLGIPPTILDNRNRTNLLDQVNLVHIETFCKGILGPEYEFDLPKGTNFIFDSSCFKEDNFLKRDFPDLFYRMR